jgi:NADH-quinone oxidoreductase subunit C
MTPEEVGTRFAAAAGDAGISASTGVSGGGGFARATVRVDPAAWSRAARLAREALGCDFFDWLSAVDELDAGFTVVAHLWSTGQRHGLLLETGLPPADPALDSIVDVYPGAAWHERETHEMFGIDFTGHPGGLRPLLLPPEFEGYPLRKQFVLASRVAKAWPGAKEPGESHDASAARRAPMRPPGVPAPGEWGPASDTQEEAARGRPVRERPARPPRAAARPAASAAEGESPAAPSAADREAPAAPGAGEGGPATRGAPEAEPGDGEG